MTATDRALLPVPNDDEARALAQRLMPQFPKDLTKEQAMEVARVALAYGLDPFLGELIPYQGRPYLTFDGRVRIADRHPAYDGYDLVPVTGEELDALRPQQGESIWKCVVYRKDRSRPTIAYGRAGGPHEKNPLAKQDPVTMAQKRAIHRALRAAFPVPIPGVEVEITDGQVRAIHAIDEELGISREERRQVLSETFGVESSRDLTAGQASSYIDMRITELPTENTGDASEDGWDATAGEEEAEPEEGQARETDTSSHPAGSVEYYADLLGRATSLPALEQVTAQINASSLSQADRDALRPIYRERRGQLMVEDVARQFATTPGEVARVARLIGLKDASAINEKRLPDLYEAMQREQEREQAEQDAAAAADDELPF